MPRLLPDCRRVCLANADMVMGTVEREHSDDELRELMELAARPLNLEEPSA